MANHKSALKRIRQNEKLRLHNRSLRNRSRTIVRKAREGLAGEDIEAARTATMTAIRELDKTASKGIIHPNNAARRKGRLMKQLAALEAQQ
jgi:small subunit ribosomal protein S20